MKGLENLRMREDAGGVVLAVKAVPGSSRNRVVGVLGDALKIAVAAPPEKGKANAAVSAVLAQVLRVDKRAVELVSGARSPRKEFRVAGMSASRIQETLAGLP